MDIVCLRYLQRFKEYSSINSLICRTEQSGISTSIDIPMAMQHMAFGGLGVGLGWFFFF